MKILVTGGAGFIGSHLVDALINAGNEVVVVDNLCLGKKIFLEKHFNNPRFTFYELDAADSDALERVFAENNLERVYHLTANSDIRKGGQNPDTDFHDTLQTTFIVLKCMRNYCVKELFFASTSAVYGAKTELLREDAGNLSPVSYYGAAKLASEAYLSAFAAMCDMSVNVARFPNVIGERLTHGVIFDFINKLRKNPRELEILGDGNQEKPYIYVKDLIDAILFLPFSTVNKREVMIFNIGLETSTNVRRIADIICEEMNLSDVKYKFTGGSVGWKGDVPKFQYDISKIHGAGWKAKYTSDEAVRLTVRRALTEQ